VSGTGPQCFWEWLQCERGWYVFIWKKKSTAVTKFSLLQSPEEYIRVSESKEEM